MKVAIIYNKDLSEVLNTFGMQNKEFYSEKNVNRVANCLESAGHNVQILDGNMHIIERLKNFMPRTVEGEQIGMVFNMAYGIQGESRYTHIPSLLEMLGVPYVGSSPSGHAIALDKVMTKILWQNKGLPTPHFWVFNSARDDLSDVVFPVIVKPKMESVSFGLRVVYNEEDLRESIHFIVTEFQQQALVEQFIRGREFCVGLLGNAPTEAFPVLEIDLEGNPDAIQTVEDKKTTPKRKVCPAEISEELAQKMTQLSVDAFKTLDLRDFARVDIRLSEEGDIYLLEINSMASLGMTGSYPTAAKVAGYDFSKLVNKMLEVAAVRYFSNSLRSELPNEKHKKLPLHNRLRAYLRSRQQNTEQFLEKLINTNTHVRHVDGVNQCANLIKMELTQLGFTNEVFPHLEVGNMMYFSNSFDEDVDYLLLLSLDDHAKIPEQEYYYETEHRLYGTGIWENKGGIATCISAIQALRFMKLLRKLKLGVFLITDSSINGKFSKKLINLKSQLAKHIIAFHGGNAEGSVVISRSGSASYSLRMKLIGQSSAEKIAATAQQFFKIQTRILEVGNNDETVIAPYKTEFSSNIFKGNAYGMSQISVRFNSLADFDDVDRQIRKVARLPRNTSKFLDIHFDGGIARPPLQDDGLNAQLLERIKKLSRITDIRTVAEHRWSSSDICNIDRAVPKIDGVGPVGGFDKQKAEFILRHSLIDRALIVALLLAGE